MGLPTVDIEAGSKEKRPNWPEETGGVLSGETYEVGDSFSAKLQRFVGRYGVEQRGIERVPEDERTDTNVVKVGTMWLAANMVISSFAIGVLAVPAFSLGFVDGFLTILFINILGILPVCFFSTFGPKFGLRQMILSRYFFGFYGVKVVAIFNCLACFGWPAVNVIVGAQLLNAVNPSFPGWAGVIVIAAGTLIITLFGYKWVHRYEMWSWIPIFIIFLITLGVFAHSGRFHNIEMRAGSSEAGSVLSFSASIFGFATGWTSMAADYTVYQPVNTSRIKIFVTVFIGLIFPLLFTQWLGLAVATTTVYDQAFSDAYTNNHIGGLVSHVLVPPLGRFGDFCLVILAMSIVGNNCPNIYSFGFNLQVMARFTRRVPRFIWTFVGTVVYCAIAIPGYSHFEAVLENFMLVIAYWLAIYEGISLPEHIIFRKGTGGYNPESWDTPSELPPGFAALGAFCFGILGAVLGMAQTWFIGPIGKLIGDPAFGGDVGFELAFSFAFVTYTVFRTIELKVAGR